jgi:hypothetical protein
MRFSLLVLITALTAFIISGCGSAKPVHNPANIQQRNADDAFRELERETSGKGSSLEEIYQNEVKKKTV